MCLSIEIQEGMTYADTLAMTRAGEALGFDAALLAEHYYPSGQVDRYQGGLGERMASDAWIYLAGLARETSRNTDSVRLWTSMLQPTAQPLQIEGVRTRSHGRALKRY